jgi:hypothetical protein
MRIWAYETPHDAAQARPPPRASEPRARPDTPPASIGRRTGRSSADAPARRRQAGGRRAPGRSDMDAAAPDARGTGPRLCPDWQKARCARIFRMTTGSCSVAMRRSRPPQMRIRQHVDAERPVHEGRPRPGARLGLFPRPVRGRGQRRRGLLRHAPLHDHSPASPGARSQDAMQMRRSVSGRGVIAASRSRNSIGSKTNSLVPSCHLPRARRGRRPAAAGAPARRADARRTGSSTPRSFADTHTLVCKSKPSRFARRGP